MPTITIIVFHPNTGKELGKITFKLSNPASDPNAITVVSTEYPVNMLSADIWKFHFLIVTERLDILFKAIEQHQNILGFSGKIRESIDLNSGALNLWVENDVDALQMNLLFAGIAEEEGLNFSVEHIKI